MNWLDKMTRPKLTGLFKKRETPENLWHKCRKCGEMAFHRDLATARYVCPNCDHHMRLKPHARLESTFDDGAWEAITVPDVPLDPLKFRDEKRYTERLKAARAKTSDQDAMTIAIGKITGQDVVVLVQNFEFMGGSLGMAAGENIVRAAEEAVTRKFPLILFAASGGARMQEGVLSLMQMPRATVAVQRLKDAGLPYIVVLTDPTTGGVTASYAMLGDIHISEPEATIGFAGARVIEQTIREKLPAGFQRAEFLLDHGMVDMIVHRHEMRETLSRVIRLLTTKNIGAAPGDKANKPDTLPVPIDAPPAPSSAAENKAAQI